MTFSLPLEPSVLHPRLSASSLPRLTCHLLRNLPSSIPFLFNYLQNVPQLLCFENDPSFMGGVYAGRVPPSSKFVQFKSARVSACLRSIPFLFTFLRTLLRFFALRENATLFFLSASALFAKKHAGVEVPLLRQEMQKGWIGRGKPAPP